MRNPTLKKAVAELHRFGILQGRRVHGGKESGVRTQAAQASPRERTISIDRYVIDPRQTHFVIFLNFFDVTRGHLFFRSLVVVACRLPLHKVVVFHGFRRISSGFDFLHLHPQLELQKRRAAQVDLVRRLP